MKHGLAIGYSGSHLEVLAALVQHAEELSYDAAWSAEAYGSDAACIPRRQSQPHQARHRHHAAGCANASQRRHIGRQHRRDGRRRSLHRGPGCLWTAIKAAASKVGRSIDEDHFGAGFAFHFGNRDAPLVERAMDAYAKRNGRDATYAFAVGDADTILAHLAEYVDVGVSKFIMRPLGSDDDAILAQTRLLTEKVLPRAEAQWPKRPGLAITHG